MNPIYRLERQQWIARPRGEVFDFFGRAENLERITPDWMGFRILTPQPIEIEAGTRIDYRIRVGPVPMRWRTAITVWDPPARFVDLQEHGPYALWRHTHTFTPIGSGTLVTDRVMYQLPAGILGRFAHAVIVRSTLGSVFDFRFRRIRDLLTPDNTLPPTERDNVDRAVRLVGSVSPSAR